MKKFTPLGLLLFTALSFAARGAEAPSTPAPAAPPARPTPPTRSPTAPGTPPLTQVVAPAVNPPVNADGDFLIGPNYVKAPELTPVEGVPKGMIHHLTMN